MNPEPQIKLIINPNLPNQSEYTLNPKIHVFNLHPIQSLDYSQPFQLPSSIISKQEPLDFIQKFAESHHYDPTSPKIHLPISTSNYRLIVDPITYSLCERFTHLDFAQQTAQILMFAKWLGFREVQQAVGAAVASNFYVGGDQKEIQEFFVRHKVQVGENSLKKLYEENGQLFQRIEQSFKNKQNENKV